MLFPSKVKTWLRRLTSFRLRLLFRGAFLLLILTALTMALAVLKEEKQRSYTNYHASFAKTHAQILSRLHHPSGVLALMNPHWNTATANRPVVLPFSALDFDDQSKVRSAIEMAGCLVRYPNNASLCVAVGNNPWAGGFIYVAGTFSSGALTAHRIGDPILDGAHRLQVTVRRHVQTWRWLAPFEPLPPSGNAKEGVRGRFTGYVEKSGRDYKGELPVKEFRGWVWQAASCFEPNADSANCEKSSFFSVRLPVERLREALFQTPRAQVEWPPKDLDQYEVRVELLAPETAESGENPAALFDSQDRSTSVPFSLDDLSTLLLPGERLTIQKQGAREGDVQSLTGRDNLAEPISPLLTRLIGLLPVEPLDNGKIAPLVFDDLVATPIGTYQLRLTGDARSVNQSLGAVATRLSGFVLAMLGVIVLAWLIIEVGLIRRVAQLSRRTLGLSNNVPGGAANTSDPAYYERFDLSDLRGHDELGVLASGLDELLRRVKEDARQSRIRNEQEKDMWHAVGHEIMSPLQSLLVLHGHENDPSYRYLSRMQQAVRILYGRASPDEAFASSSLTLLSLDLAQFLREVAENSGVSDLECEAITSPTLVRADAYSLEDVFSHLLNNAERHRLPATPIRLELQADEQTAKVLIHNQGAPIPDDQQGKIFEYGVSDLPETHEGAPSHRGQGLFVAKTYLAKMGGTISVRNTTNGVCFEVVLQRMAGEA